MESNPIVSVAAHAQAIFANALAQLAQATVPAESPNLLVVLMDDARQRVVLLYDDPSHDGLRLIRGGCIAYETEPAAAARLLEHW